MRGLIFLLCSVAILALCCGSAYGQGWNIDLIGSAFDSWDWPYDVAISGQYAFVTTGLTGMKVVDISDPALPVTVATLDTLGCLYRNTLAGNYLYVYSGIQGFYIIDVSDPLNPHTVGSFSQASLMGGLAVSGNYAFAGNWYYEFFVVDISNPAQPQQVGYLSIGEPISCVVVQGDYAYLACNENLRIIDVSNPNAPQQVGSFAGPVLGNEVLVRGNYAYLADWDYDIWVVDVSDPADPWPAGSVSLTGINAGMALEDDYLYVADPESDSSRIHIVDVSNPGNPQQIGSVSEPDAPYGVAISGNYAYVASHFGGFKVFDVTIPASPTLYSFIEQPGRIWDVALCGNTACVSDQLDDLLYTVDISDPSNPEPVGMVSVPDILFIVSSGNYVFASGYNGLGIIDASNINAPTLVSMIPGSVGDVAISGDYLYVIDYWQGLQIMDISDPANPVLLSLCPGTERGIKVAVSGDLAFVTTSEGQSPTLIVINVADPQNPSVTGTIEHSGEHFYSVAATGDYAYVAGFIYSVQGGFVMIVDVSDPSNPTMVCQAPVPTQANDLEVVGSHVFAGCDMFGLYVYEHTPPDGFSEIAYYLTAGRASGMAIRDDMAFLADEAHLLVLDCSDFLPVAPGPPPDRPLTFALHPAHPNPFNPVTMVSFVLPQAARVNLSVYDVAGHLVSKLVEGWREAGNHEITFDGSGLASGVYLCRLSAAKYTAAAKLVVVK
jgi:hypothetical protein